MVRKRRFGVAIPKELAESLDRLASILGSDRSRVVSEALSLFVQENLHYLSPHRCRGVFVLTGSEDDPSVYGALRKFRDMIRSYNHSHVGGECVETIVVSGPSQRVTELHKALMATKHCRLKFVPIACPVE